MQVELKQNRKWMGCKLTPRRVFPIGITFSKLAIGDTHWIEITIQWTSLCPYLEQCYELWEITGLLSTASQSGGWVPETSRSFHYWQPAPRWRPLPRLANPGNPPHSPHAEREKTGTRHTDKTVERKGGTGEGRQPPRSPHAQENANAPKTLTKTPTKLLQRPMDQEHEESWRISSKPLTARVKLVLLVVVLR